MMISNYSDFESELIRAGFSIGGENDEGVFSLCSYFAPTIQWHTGDAETDPWEWRMRVLEERDDTAYSKIFFKKSGFITKEWYRYFLAVRRVSTIDEAYSSGTIGHLEKRIYDAIEEKSEVPLHDLKRLLEISKEESSKFDKAMVELQMKMYITTSGRKQKSNRYGEAYGWSSTVFCSVDKFFGSDFVEDALLIDPLFAENQIKEQVAKLNPNYNTKKLMKFIKG
jgi:hypothetical protein